MSINKIICPNCGAENEYGGTCQYCGCAFQSDDSHISVGDELEAHPHFLNDGKYKYFWESFDKIEKVTKTDVHNSYFYDYESGPRVFYRECTSEGENLIFLTRTITHSSRPTHLSFILNGKRFDIIPSRMEKYPLAEEKKYDWIVYCQIDQDILRSLCDIPKKLEVRISFEEARAISDFLELQKAARLLYNRLYDNTAYMDTIMRFQRKMDEIDEFKKRQEEDLKRKIEEREEWEKRRAEAEAAAEAKQKALQKRKEFVKTIARGVCILSGMLVSANIIFIIFILLTGGQAVYGYGDIEYWPVPIPWRIWLGAGALLFFIFLFMIYVEPDS